MLVLMGKSILYELTHTETIVVNVKSKMSKGLMFIICKTPYVPIRLLHQFEKIIQMTAVFVIIDYVI